MTSSAGTSDGPDIPNVYRPETHEEAVENARRLANATASAAEMVEYDRRDVFELAALHLEGAHRYLLDAGDATNEFDERKMLRAAYDETCEAAECAYDAREESIFIAITDSIEEYLAERLNLSESNPSEALTELDED